MVDFRAWSRALPILLVLPHAFGQSAVSAAHFPYPETLTYQVQWRLIDSGIARVELARDNGSGGWDFNLRIESAGLVSRLYRVFDVYKVKADKRFCLQDAELDAQEGKKHSISKLTMNASGKKLLSYERDLTNKADVKKEFDVAPCTREIVGALASIRTLDLHPGQSTVVPIADGKKFARVRIEAQSKENVNVGGKNYAATRCEAFLFDNVLYKRRGRLLMWISDDGAQLPVQFRLLMGFPIGTVTVSLQKQVK